MSHFNHRPYIPGETIAAIATAPGEGGIAIIRISGKKAVEVAEKVFSGPVKKYLSHTAHYGFIKDSTGAKIDEALLVILLGKRSYTGEDTVELQCHGGMVASKKVLHEVLKGGARLAQPGEFTLKAFMNGRLDLAQAEAVQQLIGAKNETAFDLANQQLSGSFSKKILSIQAGLTHIAAILEAWVDFPEEGIEFASFETLVADLESFINEIKKVLSTYARGKKIHEGLSLCILGNPNAGKSSLMNALLDRERAIVTEIAGTTRDLIEEEFRIKGLHFRLVDTAGIRATDEVIEKEGIRRSFEALARADIVLWVIDASKSKMTEEIKKHLQPAKTIVVWNKTDLPHSIDPYPEFPHQVSISAKEKIGLERLIEKIEKMAWSGEMPSKEEVVLTVARHYQALERALQSCLKAHEGLSTGSSPEFLVFDLREALFELGTIIGLNVTEDILSSIFSQFCIGK